jgi:integrase
MTPGLATAPQGRHVKNAAPFGAVTTRPAIVSDVLPYVIHIRAGKRDYYYFRYGTHEHGQGGVRVRLPGAPGSREFLRAYETLRTEHVPAVYVTPPTGFPVASLGWAIGEYKRKSPKWRKATDSTREVYTRRFDWLSQEYGAIPLSSFDEDLLRDIRDLPEFGDKPSVADMTIERFAHVWDFAREHLRAQVKLAGANPGRGLKKAQESEGESAPVWPAELCQAFEKLENRDLVTFYFLARFTGQRRSDLVNMRWDHIKDDEMFVAQVKTGARIWVPMPARLREYLADWPKRGPFIVMSPKGRGKPTPWRETSVTNQLIKATRALGFETTDSNGAPRFYSPHGLRHLCGIELAHAGASEQQIAAVLGHASMKMVRVYLKQADQRLLARGAQAKRDAMYARERREAAIEAASNVARLARG